MTANIFAPLLAGVRRINPYSQETSALLYEDEVLARIAAQQAQIKGLVGDLAEVEALEMQHGAVIERLETALAAERAKTAKLVEALTLIADTSENGTIRRIARAAITEASQ